MSVLQELKNRFATALATVSDTPDQFVNMIRPAQDAKFGDFQANFAMPLAKRRGEAPRDIAQQIVDAVDVTDLCEPPEVAGPGFINLRLRREWLEQRVERTLGDDRLGVPPVTDARHYVVDFSSPNVAKPMHVGHLRSTVIGDAICRILRFLGHTVTSDNHLGDWGTQFGMIIYGYKHFRDESALADDMVTELARLYRLVNRLSDYHKSRESLPQQETQLAARRADLEKAGQPDASDKKARKAHKALTKTIAELQKSVDAHRQTIDAVTADEKLAALADEHPEIAVRARRETAKLHEGDAENLGLWNRFLPACLEMLQVVYDRLGISFDLTLGESFYQPLLSDVVDRLKSEGIAAESDGATCVFVEGNAAPFIVRKADGAFTYGTTDLATIDYRVNELHADHALYVVDARQSEHFGLLFATARKWGYDKIDLRHVSFGTILDQNKRPYKTRSGDTVGLIGLLDEAVARARAIVDANDESRRDGPVLSEEERAQVAEVVGLGGVKYADLSHSRDSDYVFDWDAMLATTGDTATYIQYAFARVHGIAQKGGIDPDTVEGSLSLSNDHERALALQLARYSDAVHAAVADFRPHLITGYLFETANAFSSFYNECPVLDAESGEARRTRLLLCTLTARILKHGLGLLGIATADKM